MKDKNIDDILEKYGRKLNEDIEAEEFDEEADLSKEYSQFKEDMSPELSRYEKLCKGLGNTIQLKIAQKDSEKIEVQLKMAHLDVTPSQVATLAILSSLLAFVIGTLITVGTYILTGSFSFVLFVLFLIFSLFLLYYFLTKPSRLANKWRLKASSQMVPCILYIVAYMKHTSNLERAFEFAARHLSPPLSLDLRKVLWDIETGKFSNIKESIDNYLESWREYNPEFIESLHLIESSLFEPTESRRVDILEKSLQVILDGVYENMLVYSREVRSPLTNLYMLGIVLPTLAIALLPLASTLLGGVLKWYHVFVLFNLIIPFFVFYMTSQVLLKRPGGYGESEVLELNPDYEKYKSNKPYVIAFFLTLPFLLIGILPFIFNSGIMDLIGLQKDYGFSDFGISYLGDMKFFDFKVDGENTYGPYGILAVILSLFIPFSIALFFSIAYNLKTKDLIKARDESKKLDKEFASSLFQLGNRLGDGVPAEVSFGEIAESKRGTVTEGFFRTVSINMQQLGMSLEQAIFNKRRGAITYYPSALIATSMKILLEAVKKGLNVAAKTLMSISDYVKNIQKINERMRDLLAEVSSDMKSNMVFLAPLLAGIVVGLSNMIVMILNKLYVMFSQQGNFDVGMLGNVQEILTLFDLVTIIPAYFLQISIGVYIVEIIFILSATLVTVDAGEDKLKEKYEIGKNLKRGIIIYLIVALSSIVLLTLLSSVALSGMS